MGTNNVTIVGRLAKDPALKGDEESPRLHFTVAVDNGKDRQGNDRDPDWIPVVVFGPYAQSIAEYLGKGHLVGVTGSIKSRKHVDETTGETRSYLNVVASTVEFLARPRGTGNGSADNEAEPAYDPAEEPF
jgi:single-strand DNA-binding protein